MKKIEDFFRPFITKVLILLLPKKQKIDINKISKKDIKKVLIVYPHNEIGDMLLATPLFRAISEQGISVGLVIRPIHKDVLINNPHIDKLYIYDKKKLKMFQLIKFINSIRQNKYDLSIVINSVSFSLTSSLLAYFSGAKYTATESKLTLEFNPVTKNLFNILINVDLSKHDILRKLDYAISFGWEGKNNNTCMILTDDEKAFYKNYFTSQGIKETDFVVCMHIGAGKIQNRWEVKKFKELGIFLKTNYNAKIIIAWGPKEERLGCEIKELAQDQFYYLPRLTLRELASFFCASSLCILNDTGVLHIASAVGANTFTFFGQTKASTWNPLIKNNFYLQAEDGNVNSISLDMTCDKVKEIIQKFC